MHKDSICVHDVKKAIHERSHVTPISASSTFTFTSAEEGMRIFTGEESGYIYSRWDNPTVNEVEARLAALEAAGIMDAKGAQVQAYARLFSSGMGALATLMSALLKPGDTIVTQPNYYGGSYELFHKVLREQGISVKSVDLEDLGAVEKLLDEDSSIRIIYIETPSNPNLACYDLQALADLAKRYGKVSVVDSTFATPILQQPLLHGIDFVMHSTTKYLNGHGNAVGGVIISLDEAFMKGDFHRTYKLLGANPSPFDAWLLYQGLRTLHLRMERHCSNALSVAQFLEQHSQVAAVFYPGLQSHASHNIASKQMSAYGGMISFEVKGGLQAGIQMMNNLKFCTLAVSLGTPDTILQHPASMSHAGLKPEARLEAGITDGLIRMSVGLEYSEDIIADLDQALNP